MDKYQFSIIPDVNLKSLYHGLTQIIAILSGHYQSLIFDTKTDVYFIGSAIEKCREMLKEVSDEMGNRETKPVAHFPETNVTT